jgi:hypothetical protein
MKKYKSKKLSLSSPHSISPRESYLENGKRAPLVAAPVLAAILPL